MIESDVGDRVKVFHGDVYSLPFEDDMFTLVFAMGVISWLESPDGAVREMARVVKPSGYVILSSFNLMRLNKLVDPRLNPAFAPLKHLLKRTLESAGLSQHPGSEIQSTTYAKVLALRCVPARKALVLRSCRPEEEQDISEW